MPEPKCGTKKLFLHNGKCLLLRNGEALIVRKLEVTTPGCR